MYLKDKKLMPPPWLACPEIERYSIGWRMGYGEEYIYRFFSWLEELSSEERMEYQALFPEPAAWKGWWQDEDTGEVLKHGGFWIPLWRANGTPKYTLPWLQKESSGGIKHDF